jgi:protein-L-isoaspartate(D-aspartate) O-methyltransferase
MLGGVGLFGFGSAQDGESDPTRARERLVQRLQAGSKIRDPRVLEAFRQTPRHLFIPAQRRSMAYEDRALPLIEQQTISQPSMIAVMLEALRPQPDDRALEVGAGCGYAAALLGQLVSEVHGIEIRPSLAEMARETLATLGLVHVQIHVGDGRHGLPQHAPFQCILVSAGAETVPPALLEQLALGGRIAIPVNDCFGQTLMVGHRLSATEVNWSRSVPCLWVPLVAGDQSQ